MLPLDHWQEEGLHFFVFALRPENGTSNGAASLPAEPPVAVFALHPEEPAPVSAVVVTPSAGGKEAQVLDLRKPENAYTAPYVPAVPAVPASPDEPLPETITIRKAAAESADDDLSAELTLETPLAPAAGEDAYQWQYRSGSEWRAIPGATSPALSLTRADIAALAGEPPEQEVRIQGLPFRARVYRAEVRLHVTRTQASRAVGQRESDAVTVAMARASLPRSRWIRAHTGAAASWSSKPSRSRSASSM